MQEDIETIVITRKLQPTWAEIKQARNQIAIIRKITLASLSNGLQNAANVQMRLSVLNAIEHNLKSMHDQINEYRYDALGADNSRKEKRALEFLGSWLSTITGVPSARDHRLVVEKIDAVRTENKGIERLLGQQNAENARILRRLHFHESKINLLTQSQRDMNLTIFKNANEIEKVEALLSLKAKTDFLLANAANLVRDIASVLQSSDSERLDRSTLSPPEISAFLTKIYRSRGNSESPLFTKENLEFYYQEKLSHSWIDTNKFALTTLLQVPIAQTSAKYAVKILSPLETLHSGLPLCLVDDHHLNYRFLSQSDYIDCRDIDNTAICQKRKIIIFEQNCTDMNVCKPWQHTLVHDLSNSKIMFILQNATTATLDCTNRKPEIVDIPARGIATLNVHCSLESNSFIISRLTFRHMMEVSESASESTFNLHPETDLLTSDPNLELSKLVSATNDSLEAIIEDNQAFNLSLNDFIVKTDRQWETLNAGAYPLEQILLWSACGLNTILAIILAVYIIKLHLLINRKVSNGSDKDEEQRRLMSITNRVMELETQYHLSSKPVHRSSTPINGESTFNFS